MSHKLGENAPSSTENRRNDNDVDTDDDDNDDDDDWLAQRRARSIPQNMVKVYSKRRRAFQRRIHRFFENDQDDTNHEDDTGRLSLINSNDSGMNDTQDESHTESASPRNSRTTGKLYPTFQPILFAFHSNTKVS